MQEYVQLAPWFVVLVVFIGMAGLLWKVIDALHEQAKLLTQLVAQFAAAPQLIPTPSSVPKPVGSPTVVTPKPSAAAPTVVDQGLVDFMKKQEGYSAKAYWDYKQYTIGYGTKASGPSEVIDQAEAERRLAEEIGKAAQSVATFVPSAPIGVKQALTDLTYNAGAGWEQQTLGTLVKDGKYDEAKSHLLQYNHAGGQVLEALTKRREAEASWFDHPL